MNRKLAFFTFIVILFITVSVIAVVYIKNKDIKTKEIPEFVNFTVYVKVQDDVTGEDVVTDFNIFNEGVIVGSGTTSIDAYEEVLVRKKVGTSMFMINSNNQDYYSNKLFITKNRARLEAYRIGSVDLNFISKTDELIFLNLSITNMDEQYRKMGFCLDHGFSYVDVVSTNPEHKIMTPPDRLLGFGVKCYNVFDTVWRGNPSIEIVLKYELFQEPDEFDSIDLVFFDSDDNGLSFVFENETGGDVGGEDFYFTITNDFVVKRQTYKV